MEFPGKCFICSEFGHSYRQCPHGATHRVSVKTEAQFSEVVDIATLGNSTFGDPGATSKMMEDYPTEGHVVATSLPSYQARTENSSRFRGVCLLNGEVASCALDTGTAPTFLSVDFPKDRVAGNVSVYGINRNITSYPLVEAE